MLFSIEEINEAWNAGWHARIQDENLCSCPYEDSILWNAWTTGWKSCHWKIFREK